MTQRFLSMLFTHAVRDAQTRNGSREAYARFDATVPADELTDAEVAFIGERDSFYLASTSEGGWPYIQHRGGPRGFIKVLDPRTLALADFRGNRQYISVGNIADDDRVALFLMDYANRRRLKLLGRMRTMDIGAPGLADALIDPTYKAEVERALVIVVEAYDWNCPQHITPRYTPEEIAPVIDSLKARIAELEAAATGTAGPRDGGGLPL